jgi:hypothetical protein
MKLAGWIASLLLIVSSSAMSCGHCIEDKIAAVYDYSVVSKAVSEKHPVLFFGVDGPIVVNAANKQALSAAISNMKGLILILLAFHWRRVRCLLRTTRR